MKHSITLVIGLISDYLKITYKSNVNHINVLKHYKRNNKIQEAHNIDSVFT